MSPAEVDQVRHVFTLVEPGDEDVRHAIELVRRNGGIDYARRKALDYAAMAEHALAGLAAGPALDALRESVAYAVDRSR